ncbi:MAG TPA: S9 family peptidase, partial [Chromatiales bacterium]|nr:S9 family peptidase [Chromatiales bacterium]
MSVARVLCGVFLLLSIVLPAPAVRADRLSLERIFSGPALSGPSLRSARLSPDGRWVTYLLGKQDRPGQLDLWAYDIAGQTHRRLVDSSLLAPQQRPLSAVEAQRRERSRSAAFSGIVRYRFSADSRRLLVPLGGDLYIYDLQADPQHAVHRITDTPEYETDARFSPKGRYVSFIRNQNLVVHDLDTGREWNIPRDGGGLVSFGMAEFIAQEEI